MYLPITNLLLTMCFSNLIQIQTIPTTTGPTSPMYIPTKNHRQTSSGNFSRHTYTGKQLWVIHDQVNSNKPYKATNLDQLEESENFNSIENHRPAESTKSNIPTQKGKLKSGISDKFQQLTKVTMKLSEQ